MSGPPRPGGPSGLDDGGPAAQAGWVLAALDRASTVAVTDGTGRIEHVNDRFCEVSKYSRQELIGRDHRILRSGCHGDEFMADLWRTISSGRTWRGEICNRASDASTYWVDTTIVPFLDARGRSLRHVAVGNEVTERRRAARALQEAETLARLGEMAAVVAHEVKNPLAGVSGALEIFGDRLPESSPDRALVGEMLAALDGLDQTMERLLAYARPRPLQRGPVAIRPLLEDVAHRCSLGAAAGVARLSVAGAEAIVSGDAGHLADVFRELVRNALQAGGGKGDVSVAIEVGEDACQVSVVDRGPGIPPQVAKRLFEPFVTTRHRGVGLGLAIAKRLVEAHGGRLELHDTPGGGTTALVSLPLVR